MCYSCSEKGHVNVFLSLNVYLRVKPANYWSFMAVLYSKS